MFDRQSIHIALLLWGCIFSLIAALCMFMSRNFDKDKRRWMLWMQVCCATLMLSDAMAWLFRGAAGMTGYWMVRISNFCVFALSDILLLLFHRYVCCYLFENDRQKKKNWRVIIVYFVGGLALLLVILSQFTHLYYYFDVENYYHRNPAYFVSLILPMIGMLLDMSLLIEYRKNINRDIFISMISYIALPLLAAVIMLFYYGISLINLAISISMILMFVVAMVEQNRNLASKEKEAADLRISMMLSQIAPHFIYNTLTAIRRMCVKDPEMAQETITEFADYLRGNLDSLNQREPIPFERELKHLKCYTSIEKKRFGDRLHVEYEINTEDFMLPALTVQPLVENAIKHGVCKKSGGGTVRIKTEERQGQIYITVSDDGVGFDPEAVETDGENHVGLKNVASRLKTMSEGHMEIISEAGKGTRVVIVFPVKKGITYENHSN